MPWCRSSARTPTASASRSTGPVAVGDHVRRRGTDVAARIGPRRGGQPPAAPRARRDRDRGVAELACHRRPRVCVVVTGDELVAPGEPLRHGQIHESNSILIAARCEQAGAQIVSIERVRDDAEATRATLEGALAAADVVVTSGGVSVGTRDHVKPALAALGVEQLFWRIAVQPGRPTWCGLREGRVVVGLPGNPLSVMVGLELLLLPALRRLAGAADAGPADVPAAADDGAAAAIRTRLRVRPVRLVAGRAPSRLAPTSRTSSPARRSPTRSRSCPRASGELAAGSPVDLIDLR